MLHGLPGEQGADMMAHHVFQPDQTLVVLCFGKIVHAGERRGQRHQRKAALPAPAAGQLDAQMQLLLADRRVLRQLLQKGQNGVVKQFLFPVGLSMAQGKHRVQPDPVQIQLAADAVEQQILLVVLAQDLFIDLLIQLPGGQPAKLFFLCFFPFCGPKHLRITHLNEFIQVGGNDCEEFCPLQQRILRLIRL